MSRLHRARGFSLVELMIAMVLGLVLIGGVVSVMLANKRSYRTNQGVSQLQESARTAYELMARDIRQTGGTGCDNGQKVGIAFATAAAWWKTWLPVKGFESSQTDTAVAIGAATGQRVSGTDSLHLRGIEGGGFPVQTHSAGAGTIVINNAATDSFVAGDQLMICDFDHSAMFTASGYTGASSTIAYTIANNCTTGLGYPTNCDGGAGNVYTFLRNSWVGRLQAVDWYIGNNGRTGDGGRSLFRRRLTPFGAIVTEELVAGVTDMQLQYGQNGVNNLVDATSLVTANDWAKVNSVLVTLTVRSTDANVSSDAATNAGRLQRQFTYLITLRNRVP